MTILKNRRPFLFSFLFPVLFSLLFWFSPFAKADPGDTTPCLLKDNKKSAVTFVIDDGYLDVIQLKYLPFFRQTGLRGTAAIITADIGASAASQSGVPVDLLMGSWPTWQDWVGIVTEGFLDIANHSLTHPDLTTVSPYRLEYEVNESKTIIDANLPNYKTICYVYPYDSHDQTVRTKVAERHFAARGGQQGYNPLSFSTEDQYYQLLQKDVLTNTPASEMNGWVATAFQQGSWLIEMWHDCDNMSGWWPAGSPPCLVIEEHLNYVALLANDVWNGTFPEVTKYIRERQEATVVVKAVEEKRIILDLTDTLDDSIFDFPLTLKTELPLTFVSNDPVRVIQEGKIRLVQPVQENGTPYVYYEAIPDRGFIQILSSDYRWRTYLPLLQISP